MLINLGCGGSSGSWYVGGAIQSNIINRECSNLLVTPIPGGAITNMKTLEKGETLLVLTIWPQVYSSWMGEPPFESPLRKTRAILSEFPIYLQIIVRKDSDIYTVEDLVTKRICPGKQGLGGEQTFKAMLAEYNLTYDDIRKAGGKVLFLDYSDSIDMMKDGLLDVIVATSALDHPPFMELWSFL